MFLKPWKPSYGIKVKYYCVLLTKSALKFVVACKVIYISVNLYEIFV